MSWMARWMKCLQSIGCPKKHFILHVWVWTTITMVLRRRCLGAVLRWSTESTAEFRDWGYAEAVNTYTEMSKTLILQARSSLRKDYSYISLESSAFIFGWTTEVTSCGCKVSGAIFIGGGEARYFRFIWSNWITNLVQFSLWTYSTSLPLILILKYSGLLLQILINILSVNTPRVDRTHLLEIV